MLFGKSNLGLAGSSTLAVNPYKHMIKRSLIALSLIVIACGTPEKPGGWLELVSGLYEPSLSPFYHGVASGDPLNDRVVIWTRVTPVDSLNRIGVTWEVAEDSSFSKIFKSDTTSTSPQRDYTVKIDVTGLHPGHTYYYRFNALGATSVIGRTRTLPEHTDTVTLAVVSCSNWEFGFFNALDKISERNVDAVIHLGDYIYEYGVGGYGDSTLSRKHLPAHEAVTLADYRTRYSQYHLDKGLRNVRQQHPFITIWDDHEVANNVYREGAQNHQSDKEGTFQERLSAARQAYYEWLPIREGAQHYRSFSFGNLADLIMLDERLEGRTQPADSLTDPRLVSQEQTMLGAEQLAWFESNLKQSDAAWRIVGNQVIFSKVDQSGPFPSQPRNLDSWDGFPYEQNKIYSFIREANIRNLVFLTGDTHASWAIEVTDRKAASPMAVEFGTPSISSSNWNEYASDDSVRAGEAKLLRANPHIRYGNARDHGYLLVTLTPQQAVAEWWYVSTLREPEATEVLGKRMTVQSNSNTLK